MGIGNQKSKPKGAGDEQINLEQEDDEFHGFSSAESLGDVQIDRKSPLLDTTEHLETDIAFKHRIAASDEDDDDSEALSDEQNHERRSLSISSEDSEEDQLSTPKARSSVKSRNAIDTSKTAFLPSLSMGGYYSGSESGGDDDFDRGASGAGSSKEPSRSASSSAISREKVWPKSQTSTETNRRQCQKFWLGCKERRCWSSRQSGSTDRAKPADGEVFSQSTCWTGSGKAGETEDSGRPRVTSPFVGSGEEEENARPGSGKICRKEDHI